MKTCTTILAALSGAAAAIPPTPACASPAIATGSAVYVEKSGAGSVRRLEPARAFNRGDRVVTVVTWQRTGGTGGFVITNPLPAALSYEDSATDTQEVSVDGGRTWGTIGQLRIGARLAAPEDVTHVRWRIPAGSTAKGRGRLAYSGIVR